MTKEKIYEIEKAKEFFLNKKVQSAIIIAILLIIIISGAWIRVQNMDLLTDSTTGEKIPLALDPYYFLRIAETKVANDGVLPEYDEMRNPTGDVKTDFSKELVPDVVILLHKTGSIFNPDLTLRYVDVIYPVVFFVLSVVLFFVLIYVLTNSKITALLSSGFLAFIPTYLYRTMAGFSDHEAIGIFAFFLVLLSYAIALKYADKKNSTKQDLYKSVIGGAIVGFFTAFTIASWGGIANYAFMIIPAATILLWLFRNQKTKQSKAWRKENNILFYLVWLITGVLFSGIFGYEIMGVVNKYVLSSQGLISVFVLGFIVVDYLMIYIYTKKQEILPKKLIEIKKYRIGLSLGIVLVLGVIGLMSIGMNVFEIFSSIIDRLLRASGTGRLGETVAENKAPFINDWTSQIGDVFFWIFLIGMLFVGIEFAKGIKSLRGKSLFIGSWIIFLTGTVFSRISSDAAILNGSGFISKSIYFLSLLVFVAGFLWVYFNEEIKIKRNHALIISWLFFMLISGRGAIRMIFHMTPFVCFMGGYAVTNLYNYWRKSKEDVLRILFLIVFVAVVFLLISVTAGSFMSSSYQQAKNTAPSANPQWQETMEWVRENTPEESIFTHWWDYGYWVQTLGERATTGDGGHSGGVYGNHLVGRYVLTTPEPDTALSFMKSRNVSYLLIDPTDLGKYPAYSSIGSGPNKEDRKSQIPVMDIMPEQTQETSNKTIRVYQGGTYVDKDIYYDANGQEIFLPKNKAVAAGVFLESSVKKETMQLGDSTQDISKGDISAKGIYMYKGERYEIPVRYVYYDGEIYESEEEKAINATVYVLPKLSQSSQGGFEINNFGSVIYLSPMVSESLFAQLYLMDDPFDRYPTLNISHQEYGQVMEMVKKQQPDAGDFINYRGLRGPIKIWKTEYPEDILVRDEFLKREVPEEGYGSLDELKFRE